MPWKPAHEAHAIERVTLTLQLREAATSKVWQKLFSQAMADFQRRYNFDSLSEGGPINIPFGVPQLVLPGNQYPGAQPPAVMAPSIQFGFPQGALQFRRLVDSQIVEEVLLSPTQFVYSATRYDRWSHFRGRAFEVLSDPLDEVLRSVDVGLVKLEYWDRFVNDGPVDGVEYKNLFRSDSRHVPGFAFGTKDLWHSHIGYFDDVQVNTKRLLNLNIDIFDGVADTVLMRSAGVYSMAQETLQNQSLGRDEIDARFDSMHAALTAMIRDVIVTDMSNRIGLGSSGVV